MVLECFQMQGGAWAAEGSPAIAALGATPPASTLPRLDHAIQCKGQLHACSALHVPGEGLNAGNAIYMK